MLRVQPVHRCSQTLLKLKHTFVHIMKSVEDPFSYGLLGFIRLLDFGRNPSDEIAAACSFCSSDRGGMVPRSLVDREMQWGVFVGGRSRTCHFSACAQLRYASRSLQDKLFGSC